MSDETPWDRRRRLRDEKVARMADAKRDKVEVETLTDPRLIGVRAELEDLIDHMSELPYDTPKGVLMEMMCSS